MHDITIYAVTNIYMIIGLYTSIKLYTLIQINNQITKFFFPLTILTDTLGLCVTHRQTDGVCCTSYFL